MSQAFTQDLSGARALKLHASAQALLSDIQRRVSRGYQWWCSGEVPEHKVLAVVTKLGHKYGALDTPVQRSRRKAAGRASAVLLVWPVRQDPAGYTRYFRFLLLATAHLEGEVMYDAHVRPVRVDLYADKAGQYHLRPVSKPDKVAFSWHLTPKCTEQMERRLAWAAGQEWPLLERTIRAYTCMPMMSGYRKQLRAALSSASAFWRRNNRPSVSEHKAQIKQGLAPDPFKATLPYTRGFPVLYDDPPMTLSNYLAANDKRRREIAARVRAAVAADHQEGSA